MEKSKGLGDTIQKITKATGINKVVDKISEVTKKPCNCGKRKETLNRLFQSFFNIGVNLHSFISFKPCG